MKIIHTHLLRVVHKWVGLVIGLQFLLWALSGMMMALLPMDEVAGGAARESAPLHLGADDQWASVQQQLGGNPVLELSARPLLDRYVYEIRTARGVHLFDAATGKPVIVDGMLASRVAAASDPSGAEIKAITALNELTLPVREHALPIWRVDFADEKSSSYYVSGSTGELLERRNDTWRLWDFFWMLHIMDYAERASFNHPLIWMFGFAAVWLATTGLWLLFRTGWRSDFKARRGSLSRP